MLESKENFAFLFLLGSKENFAFLSLLGSKENGSCYFLLRLLKEKRLSDERLTKEKSARLAPVRSLKKSNPRCGLNFLRCAPLPPPPAVKPLVQREPVTAPSWACVSAGIGLYAEPSAVLNCCVVGIRRPNAGERNDGENGGTPGERSRAPGERSRQWERKMC